jgi:integrase
MVAGRPVSKEHLKDRQYRTITIDPIVVEALKDLRKRQRRERLRAETWAEENGDLVFTYSDGRFVHPKTAEEWLDRAIRTAAIDQRITPHGMRHSHGAILLRNGWKLHDVSASLGHKDSSVTERVYAHIGTTQAPREPRSMLAALREAGLRTSANEADRASGA